MPVTAPADRRFLRAQVKPGRRHSPWRVRLRAARSVLVGLVLLALAWKGGVAVAHSGLFRVGHVLVTGNHHLTDGEVRTLLTGLAGRSILAVDLDEWRGRLRSSPWIEEASLHRSLPGTIEVAVVERFPIAIGRIGEELYLVDDRGTIIDEYGPRYKDLDLPILDGLDPVPGREVELDARRARLAARVLTEVHARPEMAGKISQLDVSDPHNAVVIVDGDTARLRLGEDRFLERLQSYFDLAPTIRESVSDVDYVDLRFGERVFVGSLAQAVTQTIATAGRRAPGVSNH
jgi:cell division septal protein FtsQ